MCTFRPNTGGEPTVHCWGNNNNFGALGILNNIVDSYYRDAQITTGDPFFKGYPTKIMSFNGFNCVYTNASKLFCWGTVKNISLSFFSFFRFLVFLELRVLH